MAQYQANDSNEVDLILKQIELQKYQKNQTSKKDQIYSINQQLSGHLIKLLQLIIQDENI